MTIDLTPDELFALNVISRLTTPNVNFEGDADSKQLERFERGWLDTKWKIRRAAEQYDAEQAKVNDGNTDKSP